MASKPTPPPDGYLPVDIYWAVALITLTLLALAVLLDSCLVGALLIFPAPFVGYWLYGRLLVLLARLSRTGRGVLVYSDSPHWREYIETGWLPHCAGKVTVLNWSRRKQWKTSPAVLVFQHFCGTQDFNPSVVLFRGPRRPLVFRFYYAFRDARHGKRGPLEGLERRLFEELGAPWEPAYPQGPGAVAPGDSVGEG